MTLTIDLPEQVEQAYVAAARARGVSVDALVSDVLRSHSPVAEAQLTEERGVPVLRTGKPISKEIVDETLESIRRERDLTSLR